MFFQAAQPPAIVRQAEEVSREKPEVRVENSRTSKKRKRITHGDEAYQSNDSQRQGIIVVSSGSAPLEHIASQTPGDSVRRTRLREPGYDGLGTRKERRVLAQSVQGLSEGNIVGIGSKHPYFSQIVSKLKLPKNTREVRVLDEGRQIIFYNAKGNPTTKSLTSRQLKRIGIPLADIAYERGPRVLHRLDGENFSGGYFTLEGVVSVPGVLLRMARPPDGGGRRPAADPPEPREAPLSPDEARSSVRLVKFKHALMKYVLGFEANGEYEPDEFNGLVANVDDLKSIIDVLRAEKDRDATVVYKQQFDAALGIYHHVKAKEKYEQAKTLLDAFTGDNVTKANAGTIKDLLEGVYSDARNAWAFSKHVTSVSRRKRYLGELGAKISYLGGLSSRLTAERNAIETAIGSKRRAIETLEKAIRDYESGNEEVRKELKDRAEAEARRTIELRDDSFESYKALQQSRIDAIKAEINPSEDLIDAYNSVIAAISSSSGDSALSVFKALRTELGALEEKKRKADEARAERIATNQRETARKTRVKDHLDEKAKSGIGLAYVFTDKKTTGLPGGVTGVIDSGYWDIRLSGVMRPSDGVAIETNFRYYTGDQGRIIRRVGGTDTDVGNHLVDGYGLDVAISLAKGFGDEGVFKFKGQAGVTRDTETMDYEGTSSDVSDTRDGLFGNLELYLRSKGFEARAAYMINDDQEELRPDDNIQALNVDLMARWGTNRLGLVFEDTDVNLTELRNERYSLQKLGVMYGRGENFIIAGSMTGRGDLFEDDYFVGLKLVKGKSIFTATYEVYSRDQLAREITEGKATVCFTRTF